MKYAELRFFVMSVSLLLCVSLAHAQQPETAQEINADTIIGPQYLVPEIKVYLTDEETGGPLANHDVVVKYYWTWDVLKRTQATDRMSTILDIRFPARSDQNGIIVIPSRIITPTRPIAPKGSEFSQPRFMSMGIDVDDEKHSSGLAIYDAEVDLSDGTNEVRRTVMLYPRPAKPKKKDY